MGIPKYLEKKIKSIVHCCGVADVPSASKPTVKTNQQLDGKPVYQSFYLLQVNNIHLMVELLQLQIVMLH